LAAIASNTQSMASQWEANQQLSSAYVSTPQQLPMDGEQIPSNRQQSSAIVSDSHEQQANGKPNDHKMLPRHAPHADHTPNHS